MTKTETKQETTSFKQCIRTKFLCATNSNGARILASCERGRKTMSYDYSLDGAENHLKACKLLKLSFYNQDVKEYGQENAGKSWLYPTISGCYNGEYFHVYSL